MPLHRLGGLVIFAFSLGAVLMGTGEKTAWALHCPDTTVICEENLFVNLYSLCVLGYAACVFAIVSHLRAVTYLLNSVYIDFSTKLIVLFNYRQLFPNGSAFQCPTKFQAVQPLLLLITNKIKTTPLTL